MLARPEIGTKEHITLWLAGKPANERYEWHSYDSCACGQYSRAQGMEKGWVEGLGDLNMIARDEPRTFGALYERYVAADGVWNGEPVI